MSDFLSLMIYPFLACLILTGIHAYLGIHVIERKVIFVDLSLAQIAALGACIALLLGFNPESWQNYVCSLSATILGALIFSLTRTPEGKIPQEAIIGIVYAVSAALAVLLLSHSAEGDEHIRHMLVGNILLVTKGEILKMAILYGVMGLIHFYFRKIFIQISTHPEECYEKGISIKKWDLLFYLTFGVVVTSSVKIAGVLLVFSFLIVPAVTASLFSDRLGPRLGIGWGMGMASSFFGILSSYYWDLPTGATVVCMFGFLLTLAALLRQSIKN